MRGCTYSFNSPLHLVGSLVVALDIVKYFIINVMYSRDEKFTECPPIT